MAHDLLKMAAVAGVAYGGLKYTSYRLKGGKPLTKRLKKVVKFLADVRDKVDGELPVTLEANDYKIV